MPSVVTLIVRLSPSACFVGHRSAKTAPPPRHCGLGRENCNPASFGRGRNDGVYVPVRALMAGLACSLRSHPRTGRVFPGPRRGRLAGRSLQRRNLAPSFNVGPRLNCNKYRVPARSAQRPKSRAPLDAPFGSLSSKRCEPKGPEGGECD